MIEIINKYGIYGKYIFLIMHDYLRNIFSKEKKYYAN